MGPVSKEWLENNSNNCKYGKSVNFLRKQHPVSWITNGMYFNGNPYYILLTEQKVLRCLINSLIRVSIAETVLSAPTTF